MEKVTIYGTLVDFIDGATPEWWLNKEAMLEEQRNYPGDYLPDSNFEVETYVGSNIYDLANKSKK